MKKIKNASQFPKRYYGLHMVEGCAEYKTQDSTPFKIFVGEDAIKNMDSTFEGKPVYVDHVDEVNVEDIEQADGYVVKSFFNKTDGKHWAEFIVTTDKGHDAISNGWALSNAYEITQENMGGKWHGMDYDKEVLAGVYEHLAIVQDPRYKESIILTPEEFKAYNEKKEGELLKLSNSNKQGVISMGKFSFFKKQKVENSVDLESTIVVLPRTKREVELSVLINEADKEEEVMNELEIDGEKVPMNELEEMYRNSKKKKNEETEVVVKKENEDDKEEEKKENDMDAEAGKGGVHVDVDSHKENEEDKEEDKKENSEDSDEDDKKENEDDDEEEEEEPMRNSENYRIIMNADKKIEEKCLVIELGSDKVARGMSRYGSQK